MPRFLLAGAAHLDRIGRFPAPSARGTSNPGHMKNMPGGAAFNVASNLAAWGATVTLATIMGDDDAALFLSRVAETRGFDLLLQHSNQPTATYNAFLEPDGDLALALADMDIYECFDSHKIVSQVAGLTSDDWLVLDANLLPTHLSALCGAANCRIACLTVSQAKAARLAAVLPQVDLLITNRLEFLSLTDGLQRAHERERKPDCIVTDGGKPLTIRENEMESTLPVPRPDHVVDVIGAGDALAAMVLLRRAQGWTLPEAAREGIRAAQMVMATEGPWSSQVSKLVGATERGDSDP